MKLRIEDKNTQVYTLFVKFKIYNREEEVRTQYNNV